MGIAKTNYDGTAYLQCTICNDHMCTKDQHLTAMVCGHTFHSCCIEEYATSCKTDLANIRCPTCRKTSPELEGLAADLLAATPLTPPQTSGSSASGHQPAAAVPNPVILGSSDSKDDDEATEKGDAEMSGAPSEKDDDEMGVEASEKMMTR